MEEGKGGFGLSASAEKASVANPFVETRYSSHLTISPGKTQLLAASGPDTNVKTNALVCRWQHAVAAILRQGQHVWHIGVVLEQKLKCINASLFQPSTPT